MEEKNVVIEMPNGEKFGLVEVWNIDKGTNDSYSEVDIWDCETNHMIGSYRGTLPDMDDEDFNIDDLIAKIKSVI